MAYLQGRTVSFRECIPPKTLISPWKSMVGRWFISFWNGPLLFWGHSFIFGGVRGILENFHGNKFDPPMSVGSCNCHPIHPVPTLEHSLPCTTKNKNHQKSPSIKLLIIVLITCSTVLRRYRTSGPVYIQWPKCAAKQLAKNDTTCEKCLALPTSSQKLTQPSVDTKWINERSCWLWVVLSYHLHTQMCLTILTKGTQTYPNNRKVQFEPSKLPEDQLLSL